MRFPCVHAAATTPAQRLGPCFAHFHPSRVSLPRNESRVGLRIVLFEACSAFTRVAACTLAPSPYFVTRFTRRLQPFRFLHSCSGCFRLERLPGGACTHWKSAALSRRTPRAVTGDRVPQRSSNTSDSGRSRPAPEYYTDVLGPYYHLICVDASSISNSRRSQAYSMTTTPWGFQ